MYVVVQMSTQLSLLLAFPRFFCRTLRYTHTGKRKACLDCDYGALVRNSIDELLRVNKACGREPAGELAKGGDKAQFQY